MDQKAFDDSGLYPYQAENARKLCSILGQRGAALDGSDTGVGKTYIICAVARHRNESPLVVCPKSVRSTWTRVAGLLGGKVHVVNYEALKGKNEWGEMSKPDGYDEAATAYRKAKQALEEFRIGSLAVEAKLNDPALTPQQRVDLRATYPLVRLNELIVAEEQTKKLLKSLRRQRRFLWHQTEVPFIVFDEGQRCKAPDSLNSKIMIAAKRQAIPVIVASATAAQSPLDMKALGYVLGLHNGVDFWKWVQRNGCKPGRFGGFQYVGGEPAMLKIHRQIYPELGVRTRREDVKNFPESQITAELYDTDQPEKIDRLYAEMGLALDELKAKSALDADLEHPLTKMLRARQEIELIKVPVYFELAQEAVDENMSVVIFLNFDHTIRELYDRLSEAEIPFGQIIGGQTTDERDLHISRFQNGDARVMLANIKAGGVGVSLHDLNGDHPRLALLSPTFSALDLTQALGRVWRQGGKTKSLQRIVLAAGTVEEHIHKRINNKLANISLLNDGDLNPLFT